MLSLPDDWKFNVKGLCLLCKESKLAVTNALNELKDNLSKHNYTIEYMNSIIGSKEYNNFIQEIIDYHF